jgi:hypothetical protein
MGSYGLSGLNGFGYPFIQRRGLTRSKWTYLKITQQKKSKKDKDQLAQERSIYHCQLAKYFAIHIHHI